MASQKRGGGSSRGRSRYFDKNVQRKQKPHTFKHGHAGDKEKDRRLGRLDEQTMGYYRRVDQQLKDGFEEEEEKCLFLNNVFTQVEEEIHLLACNQTVSRILETLLHQASTSHLTSILRRLKQNKVTSLCMDRFAGYVIQTIVGLVSKHLSEASGNTTCKQGTTENKKVEKEEVESLCALFLEVCEEMVKDVAGLVRDHYGSHVLRAVFETLSGVKLEQKVVRSRLSLGQQNKVTAGKESTTPSLVTNKPPPPSFLKMLQQLTEMILKVDDFSGLVPHVVASPVLQALLTVLHKVDQGLCTQVCQQVMQAKVFTKTCAESELSGVCLALVHQHASYIVKTLLTVADNATYQNLFQLHFIWRLLPLSLHPVATFGLQQLLSTLRTEEQLTDVLEELLPHFEDLLAHGKATVLINMADACVRHQTGQLEFLKTLLKAFHIPKEDKLKCAQLLASLQSYQVFMGLNEDGNTEEQKSAKGVLTTVTLQGSLLLQHLLRFSDNTDVMDSIAAMSAQELQTLACNSFGSHVLECFLTSTTGVKKKKKLLQKMMDLYVLMSCDRSGSRVMDAVWKVAPVEVKTSIAEKLVEKEDRLRSDQYGRFVWQNCAIDHYRRHQGTWMDIQAAQERKRKLFQDILAEDTPPKKPRQETKDPARTGPKPDPGDHLAPELAILGVGLDQDEEEDDDRDTGSPEDNVTCVSLCSQDRSKRKDARKLLKKKKKKQKQNLQVHVDDTASKAMPKKEKKKNLDTERGEQTELKNSEAGLAEAPSSGAKMNKKKNKLQKKKKHKKFQKLHPQKKQ